MEGLTMLSEIHIQNFAVIEDIQLKFGSNLTVMSGEEGAGKSLIVDAIGILLGSKAPAKIIRSGSGFARVEGIFWLSPQTVNLVSEIMRESDIDIDGDGMLFISREIQQTGRTIARINSRVVTQSLLKSISRYLIDIHGQLDYISLLDQNHQLDLLDAYGKSSDSRIQVKSVIDSLRIKTKELSDLTVNVNQQRVELLRYQIDEIERAKLQENEDDSIRQQLDILTRAEMIKESCIEAYNDLHGDERSATVLIHQALSTLRNISGSVTAVAEHKNDLENAMANLEDIARELRTFSDTVEADAGQLEELQLRSNLISNLKHKYGSSTEEILQFKKNAELELSNIENHEEHKNTLRKEISLLETQSGRLSEELSLQRRTAAQSLSKLVNDELKDIGLEWAKFDIGLNREESASGLPVSSGRRYAFTRDGIDNVDFMVSTNPGEPVRPLRLIASGGETCRIMLALKSALRKIDPIPTLVFDEIDAGVGGRSADVVGKKLSSLAQQHQVVCITHLPQIACFADTHIKLSKQNTSGRTFTRVENVDGTEKIKELAAMLGSQYAGKTMLDGAEKLAAQAQVWKKKEKHILAA
jgi:DNA repair protein RecN (Recombination protein N)